MKRTAVIALLILALLCSLSACGEQRGTVRLGVLLSEEAAGALRLVDRADSRYYEVTSCGAGERDRILEALKAGELDAAIIPTADALRLYNETGGQVRLLALISKTPPTGQDEYGDKGEGYPFCAAVRRGVLSGADVKGLLNDLSASVKYMTEGETSDLMEKYGLGKAETAAQPVFISGPAQVQDAVTEYLQSLYYRDPAQVGGFMPDDAFYDIG